MFRGSQIALRYEVSLIMIVFQHAAKRAKEYLVAASRLGCNRGIMNLESAAEYERITRQIHHHPDINGMVFL